MVIPRGLVSVFIIGVGIFIAYGRGREFEQGALHSADFEITDVILHKL